MTTRPAEKILRLRHILEVEASVPANVADFLIKSEDGPQLESPADLAKLWDSATARGSVVADVLDRLQPPVAADSFPGRKLAGRLLAAWDYAQHDHSGDAAQKAKPASTNSEEKEGEWPEERQLSCAKEVKRLCGDLVLAPEQLPSSPIMNRLDRLWRERKQDLLQLSKMKNAADYALLLREPTKEEQVAAVGTAASLFLRQGDPMFPEIDLGSTEQVLAAITLLSNAWLMLGTKQVPSKVHKDDEDKPTIVQEWGITTALAWPTFVRKMAGAAKSLGDSDAAVAKYLRVRERQTRAGAAVLWAVHNWPWEEAMRRVWETDLAVLWTVTQQSNAFGLQVAIPGVTDQPASIHDPDSAGYGRDPSSGKGAKRARTDHHPAVPAPDPRLQNVSNDSLELWMCCRDFNRGSCTAKQSACPHGLLHRCSSRPAGGRICGQMSHGAATHTVAHERPDKGKGRGKGKGKDAGNGKNKNWR